MIAIAVGAVVLLTWCVGVALRSVVVGPRRTVRWPAPPPGGPTRRRSRIATLIGALAVVIAFAVVAPIPAAIAVGSIVIVCRTRPIRAARRQRSDIERALPDALDLLVLGIRAGLTPQQAIAELAVHAPESVRGAFASTVHRTERGQSFADALTALPETLGPGVIGLADVIATSDRYGLPLGPVLDQLTTEARDARRRLDQADARKLPVRLSFPLVVCTLPSFVLLAIAPAVIAALSSLGGAAW